MSLNGLDSMAALHGSRDNTRGDPAPIPSAPEGGVGPWELLPVTLKQKQLAEVERLGQKYNKKIELLWRQRSPESLDPWAWWAVSTQILIIFVLGVAILKLERRDTFIYTLTRLWSVIASLSACTDRHRTNTFIYEHPDLKICARHFLF